MHRWLSPRTVLAVVAGSTLLGSTMAAAAGLTISGSTLSTFTRGYGSPVSCSIEAAADAHVREDDPSTNYGSGLVVEVDALAGTARRVFLRFDLADCVPGIPADAIVHSATLRLTLASATSEARTYDLHRAAAGWMEGSLQWGNQPAAASSTSASVALAAGTPASSAVEWNVVADVQDLVSGAAANDGWRVSDASEGSATSSLLQAHAREAAADRPLLVITYVE